MGFGAGSIGWRSGCVGRGGGGVMVGDQPSYTNSEVMVKQIDKF